jgi:hypothetical protein
MENKTRRIDRIVSNIEKNIKDLELEKVNYENKLLIVNEKISTLQHTLKEVNEVYKNCNYID